MPNRQFKQNRAALDKEIGLMTDALAGLSITDDDYKPTLKALTALTELRTNNYAKSSTEMRDWLPIVGQVGAITLIVTFEAFGHSVTSKAMALIPKPTTR